MIMLTNLEVPHGAPAGTPVGTLHAFGANRAPVPAFFELRTSDAGAFAITNGTLLTTAAPLDAGNYSIRVRAIGADGFDQRGRFPILVVPAPSGPRRGDGVSP